jgi:exodeoxyribonuclease III
VKLVSWNVNGLRSILAKGFDAFLAAEQPDVLCLQEIKATPDKVAWTPPADYAVWWNPAVRPGYSGTLTLTQQVPLAVNCGIGVPDGDAEGRVQTIEFADCFVVNVYTPNARGDLSRLAWRTQVWDPAFREHCVSLASRKPVLFCGDLNVAHQPIDLANPAANRGSAGFTDEERAAFQDLLDAGFVDSFRLLESGGGHYSWWSYRAGARARNVGWRIDYVGASSALAPRIKQAFIRPQVSGSDHCPVGVVLG